MQTYTEKKTSHSRNNRDKALKVLNRKIEKNRKLDDVEHSNYIKG